ncbi:MAG TPA: choice-of-anchor R domain-containing protein [Thermoplasmata archaeon]|nr:choice-of-anchor R domain-containing protein [Thermoplasmata archaeon]
MFRVERGDAFVLLVLVVLVSLASAAAGYGERVFNANPQTSPFGYPIASGLRAAQSFLVAEAIDLRNVTLYVNNTGLSQGDPLNVTIQTDAGGNPSGLVLAASQAARSGSGWLDFPFAPALSLQRQTSYWIVASSNQTLGEGYVWYHSTTDVVPGEAKVDQGLGWIIPTPVDMTYLTYGILREPTIGIDLRGPWTVEAGTAFSYSVYINNTGLQLSPMAWVNVTLPAGIQYVSDNASGLGGTKTGNFNWSFPNLANGPHSFSVGVRIDDLVASGLKLSAQATLVYANSTNAIKSVPPSSTMLIVSVKPRDLFLSYDGVADRVDKLVASPPTGIIGDFDNDGQPGLTVAAGTTLANGPSWRLLPPLARPFLAVGPVSATLYLDSAVPNDTVELGVALFDRGTSSSPVTITITNLTLNALRDWEPFTVDLRYVWHRFNAGNQTELVLFNRGNHAAYVAYNASAVPSRLTVSTPSYVAFDSVRVLDSHGPTLYVSTADSARLEANVSHPLGSAEIAGVRAHVVDPDGVVVVPSDPLALTRTDPAYPSAWKVFVYTYPSPVKQGTYTFLLTASDSVGAWAKAAGSFVVRAPVLNLTVLPATAFRRALDSVAFSIYMNNTGQADAAAWLNVTLPSGLIYVSDTSLMIGGAKTGDYNWSFPVLTPGPHNFTLATQVGAVPGLSVLTVLFDLRYSDAKGFAWSTPTAQSRIVLGGARILPTVSLDKSNLHPREPLAITIHFDNVGDGDSAIAWINVTLGPNLVYWTDNGPGTKNVTGDPLRYIVFPVPLGAHAFTIRANGSAGLSPGVAVAVSVVVDYALSGPLAAHSLASGTVTGSGPTLRPVLSGATTANPGDVVNVTLDYSNRGTEAAVGALVNVSLGSQVVFVSASVPPTSVPGNWAIWSFPAIALGSHSLSILVKPQPGVADGAELLLRANVSFQDVWGNSFLSGSGILAIRITAPILAIDVYASAGSVEPGDLERTTVSYANLGSGTASTAWINLSLPNEMVYVADDAGPAPVALGSVWSWRLSSVATGIRLFHVDLRIASWAADGKQINLVATIQGTDMGGNPVNGSVRNLGYRVQTAAVTVEAFVPSLTGIPGEDFTTAVYLNNTGSRTAILVWLNLTYGSGLTFLGDTSGLPRQTGPGSVSWLRLALAPSDHVAFTFSLHVTARPGDVASMNLEASYSNSKGVLVGLNRTHDFVFRAVEPPKGLLEQPSFLALIAAIVAASGVGFWVWSSRRYRIEEVFLINKTGILLHHVSRRTDDDGNEGKEKDRDLVGAMLTVVQQFVQDAFAYREDRVLKELEFGDYRLLIERGEEAFLAVVFVGADNAHLRRWARRTLGAIEGEFGQVLATWNGNTDDLAGIRESLDHNLAGMGGASPNIGSTAPEMRA